MHSYDPAAATARSRSWPAWTSGLGGSQQGWRPASTPLPTLRLNATSAWVWDSVRQKCPRCFLQLEGLPRAPAARRGGLDCAAPRPTPPTSSKAHAHRRHLPKPGSCICGCHYQCAYARPPGPAYSQNTHSCDLASAESRQPSGAAVAVTASHKQQKSSPEAHEPRGLPQQLARQIGRPEGRAGGS